jgi:hypothetical protein
MFILLCAITHVIHIKLVYMFVSVYKHVMRCQISNVDVVTGGSQLGSMCACIVLMLKR